MARNDMQSAPVQESAGFLDSIQILQEDFDAKDSQIQSYEFSNKDIATLKNCEEVLSKDSSDLSRDDNFMFYVNGIYGPPPSDSTNEAPAEQDALEQNPQPDAVRQKRGDDFLFYVTDIPGPILPNVPSAATNDRQDTNVVAPKFLTQVTGEGVGKTISTASANYTIVNRNATKTVPRRCSLIPRSEDLMFYVNGIVGPIPQDCPGKPTLAHQDAVNIEVPPSSSPQVKPVDESGQTQKGSKTASRTRSRRQPPRPPPPPPLPP